MALRLLLAIVALAVGTGNLVAGIIAGPAMTGDLGGHTNWGIRFSATTSGTLDGFDYLNQGKAGTLELRDAGDNSLVWTQAHAAGSPTLSLTGLAIAITAGKSYNLLGVLGGGTDNGRFAAFGGFPVSNADISVSGAVLSGALNTLNWASFNNIATNQPAAVPEPSSFLALSAMAMAFPGLRLLRRRRERQAIGAE